LDPQIVIPLIDAFYTVGFLNNTPLKGAYTLWAGPPIYPELYVAVTLATVLDPCDKSHLLGHIISCVEMPCVRFTLQ